MVINLLAPIPQAQLPAIPAVAAPLPCRSARASRQKLLREGGREGEGGLLPDGLEALVHLQQPGLELAVGSQEKLPPNNGRIRDLCDLWGPEGRSHGCLPRHWPQPSSGPQKPPLPLSLPPPQLHSLRRAGPVVGLASAENETMVRRRQERPIPTSHVSCTGGDTRHELLDVFRP